MYESEDLEVTFHVMGTAVHEDPALADSHARPSRSASSPSADHLSSSTLERKRAMAYDPSSTEGVPEAGRERLAQNQGGLYTSDLSVNEFLLVRHAGFQPLGLVMGSSIYQHRLSAGPVEAESGDAGALPGDVRGSRAGHDRMEEEARPARRRRRGRGAARDRSLRVGQSMAEFLAIGTAVKHREGKLHRAPSGRPFTSDLSGQEFWALLQTGHRRSAW